MKQNYTRIALLFFGSLLIIDCLALFALLKFNFGTIVPLLIGLIFLAHAIFWEHIQAIIADKSWLKRVWQALWLLFFVWLVSFVLFIMTLLKQVYVQKPLSDVQAVIVLGAGVNGDKPTATLASRLDKAADIFKEEPAVVAITSGGVGIGREHSEAFVMAKYLSDKHAIPISRIQQEGNSSSTEENLQFSQAILQANGINPAQDSIAIVTNDFHTVRAVAIAKKQGYGNVTPVASSTPLSIRFNAWFREYFAYISGWLLGEY